MDIGQGAGLATASGVRPLVPPIVAGVLARADAGTDFSHTDWSWMESWVWIGALVVVFLAGFAGAEEGPYFVTYDQNMEEPGNLEISILSTVGSSR